MRKELTDALTATRRAASTSRKAFWLLKSFNHVGVLIKMGEKYSLIEDRNNYFVTAFDMFEQFFLSIYFIFENIVFLARHDLVSFGEEEVDDMLNLSWFAGDLACYIAAFIRLVSSIQELANNYREYFSISLIECRNSIINLNIVTPFINKSEGKLLDAEK